MRTNVEIGQTWQITEPNGDVRTFTITHLQRGMYGRRAARGVTSGGRQVMVEVRRLEDGLLGARLVRGVNETKEAG